MTLNKIIFMIQISEIAQIDQINRTSTLLRFSFGQKGEPPIIPSKRPVCLIFFIVK